VNQLINLLYLIRFLHLQSYKEKFNLLEIKLYYYYYNFFSVTATYVFLNLIWKSLRVFSKLDIWYWQASCL